MLLPSLAAASKAWRVGGSSGLVVMAGGASGAREARHSGAVPGRIDGRTDGRTEREAGVGRKATHTQHATRISQARLARLDSLDWAHGASDISHPR